MMLEDLIRARIGWELNTVEADEMLDELAAIRAVTVKAVEYVEMPEHDPDLQAAYSELEGAVMAYRRGPQTAGALSADDVLHRILSRLPDVDSARRFASPHAAIQGGTLSAPFDQLAVRELLAYAEYRGWVTAKAPTPAGWRGGDDERTVPTNREAAPHRGPAGLHQASVPAARARRG